MDKTYKYDAFISYRHNDLDKFAAENLHKLIETYKIPKEVVEKYNIKDNDYRRVFRDQDELQLAANLEDPIVEALKESKFLIVICSPRLKESKWCKKEIESFIKLHGRGNILCVLVEGEPNDSFPEILQYREEKIITKSGKEKIEKIPCEPLAMDVRGKDKKEIYQNLKKELIRVIAPMYNLDYDDIKRRHEEREQKRKANILKAITFASIIFGIYSFILFSNIYRSNNELKYAQSISLANRAVELLQKDDRIGAVKTALESVTEYEGIDMPQTAHGISVIADSLWLYYHDKQGYYPISQLETSGEVKHMKRDISWHYLLSYDESGKLTLWNLENEKKVKEVYGISSYSVKDKFTFIGKKQFAYIKEDEGAVVFDINGNEVTKIKIDNNFARYSQINASTNGKYLEICTGKKIIIYETEKYQEVATYEVSKDLEIVDQQYFDDNEEYLAFVTKKKDNVLIENNLDIITYNIKQKKVVNKYNIKANSLLKLIFKDNSIVTLTSRHKKRSDMLLTKYNFKTGSKIYYKEYISNYGTEDMELAYSKDGDTTLLLVSGYLAYVVDYKTGKERDRYEFNDNIISIQPLSGGEGYYQLISSKGEVIDISIKDSKFREDVSAAADVYHFNLPGYTQMFYTTTGYVGFSNHSLTGNTNRIVIYDHLKNDNFKEIDYKEDIYNYNHMATNDLSGDQIKLIAIEYNLKEKDLISKAFYSDDRSLLFVYYNYKKLEIYNNNRKKLIKSIENVKYEQDVYIGKTKDDKYIIRGTHGGYILNEDFDIISYVPCLVDYKDNQLIIEDWGNFYSIKLYSEEEIIAKAEEFLKEKGK